MTISKITAVILLCVISFAAGAFRERSDAGDVQVVANCIEEHAYTHPAMPLHNSLLQALEICR